MFRRYFTKLYTYTLSYTKDNLIAEELVMDVMLVSSQKNGNITVESTLNPYLFRTMKNSLINHWRKKAIVTTALSIIENYSYADPKAADHELLSRELDDLYHQQLVALSRQRKKVFELSRNENMTYPEIAPQLNLSVKNSRKPHQRRTPFPAKKHQISQ